ncbi:MAG: hypothetical protein H7235_08705 [Bdellovibrionaceae bacterium]|nr:hypothetical protein [Pseudobdellovibrionaceae bacterium]
MNTDNPSQIEMNLTLEILKVQLRETQANYRHARKALEFYANLDNWYIGDSFKQSCRINENDLEYFPHGKTSDLIGGKMARLHLKDIDA